LRNVLDVENTTTKRDGKTIMDPFEPGNTLTQVGVLDVDNWKNENIITLDHVEYKDNSGAGRKDPAVYLGYDNPVDYAQCTARLDVAMGMWLQV
jgi:hypothetical protein